jgi:predicted DNA-binding transcriptional regulator YafY
MTKTERWLNLLAFLLERHYPVPREEILSQVEDYKSDWVGGTPKVKESVRRKFERDKKELREIGVVIEPLTDKVMADHAGQEVEAYLLKARDFYLPYLDVSPRRGPRESPAYYLNTVTLDTGDLPILRRAAERVAALVDTPLGVSARSALRKLAFDLPELSIRDDDERAFVQPTPPELSQHFAILRQAVEEQRAARCVYYSIGRDAEEARVIEPYGLMLSWGYWYCVARSRERKAMRVFRLDRMKNVELVEGARAEFTVPRDFSIGTYLDRAPWELSDERPIAARVRIAFPQSRWVIGERIGKVVKALTDDAGTEFEFQVRSVDGFVRWLLPLGRQVEVLSPPAIKRQLEEARARLRTLYS